MNQSVTVIFDGNTIDFREHSCYESRGKSVVSMTRAAFNRISPETVSTMKPFSAVFFLGDKTDHDLFFSEHYPFSFSFSSYHDALIPCFAFDRWVECGMDDYDNICKDMIDRSSAPPKDERLFWIGNCGTNKTRDVFCEMTQSDPTVCAVNIGRWHKVDGSEKLKTDTGKYVSIPEHCDYKYLIDLQGAGWSARTKFLFHSGRPVFYQERKWNEYWFFWMQPFYHYIPVKEDLSDFKEKYEWAKQNSDHCNFIAQNALDFSKKHLKREDAIARYKSILMRLGGAYI